MTNFPKKKFKEISFLNFLRILFILLIVNLLCIGVVSLNKKGQISAFSSIEGRVSNNKKVLCLTENTHFKQDILNSILPYLKEKFSRIDCYLLSTDISQLNYNFYDFIILFTSVKGWTLDEKSTSILATQKESKAPLLLLITSGTGYWENYEQLPLDESSLDVITSASKNTPENKEKLVHNIILSIKHLFS